MARVIEVQLLLLEPIERAEAGTKLKVEAGTKLKAEVDVCSTA